MLDVAFLQAHVALGQGGAGGIDRAQHRSHDRLRTDRAGRDGLAAGSAIQEHKHRPACRLAGDASGHADAGGDLVPLIGGVEATVEMSSRRRTHCRGDRRGPRTRIPHVDTQGGAGGLLLRCHPVGDLGLHRPDGEAPAIGEHDDPVAPIGAPGKVVARVGHAAVVEPELTLLIGVPSHVGRAPNRDPPIVGGVGVGERQRHLLFGWFDVAEHDEGAAAIVANHDWKDRRTHVLGPAAAVGVGGVDVTVDRLHRLGGQDPVHSELQSTRRPEASRS